MIKTKVEQTILSTKFAYKVQNQDIEVAVTIRWDHVASAVVGVLGIHLKSENFMGYFDLVPAAIGTMPQPELPQALLQLIPDVYTRICGIDWEKVYKEKYQPRLKELISFGFTPGEFGLTYGNNLFYVSHSMMRIMDDVSWKKWMLLFLNQVFN